MDGGTISSLGARSSCLLHALTTKARQLRERAEALKLGVTPIKEIPFSTRSHEFGDVVVTVQSDGDDIAKGAVTISVEVSRESTLGDGASEAVQEVLGDVVNIEKSSNAGVSAGPYKEVVRAHFDLQSLPIVDDPAKTEAVIGRVSTIAAVVMGGRLRYILSCLANNRTPTLPSSSDGGVVAVTIRDRQTFFVKPSISDKNINASAFGGKNNNSNNVAVLFPMWFKEQNDVVIAHSFLQEFVEIRRQSALNTAPIVSYHRSRPLELKDVTHPDATNANGGYMTFVLNGSHVTGARLDSVTWALSSFFEYISYHIKSSKASFHASMRKRTSLLMQVLNRAKQEGAKEKKLASGKAFNRAVH